MSDLPTLPAAHAFTHDAMNTTFTLRICEADKAVARGLAHRCFEQIDLLESHLSRFIDGSDVSRINHLQAGETLYISELCYQCLLTALDGHARTGGLFDITLGHRIEHRKSAADGPPPSSAGKLTIHPDVAAVTCEEPGREIDLGGIGKGFALDNIRQLLIDWGAEGALISAGASSLLAFGPQPWPVDLSGDSATARIILHNAALSASGTGIQGSHIIHPAGDEAMPAAPCKRLWTVAPTAALAEIWSTALMLLDPVDIPAFIEGEETLHRVHIDRDGVHQLFPHS
ncbi:MAG: FAD:protein FMN transferase [Akkermansiaceae bacterium]